MSVRAKFRCMSVEVTYSHHRDGAPVFHHGIRLLPVFGTKRGGGSESPENDAFYAATPSGEIKLTVVSAQAAEHFKPGECYYVDFSPAGQ